MRPIVDQAAGSDPTHKRPRVLFLGGTRYRNPLDPTSGKKFRALSGLADLFVVGFAEGLRPVRFTEHGLFTLMPQVPWAMVRYAEMIVIGLLLAIWFIFRHNVQVLVAQSPYEGFPAALAKVAMGLIGRKVILVVESHGDFEESLFMQRHVIFSWLYRPIMRRIARFTLRQADLLRSISNSTSAQLVEWAPGKHIVQFPTWTDIDSFLQAGAQPKERDSDTVLYSGVVIPRKGLHHLIKAFASIANDYPTAELVLIGKEENATYAAELKARLRALGLERRVRFEREVSQKDLAARMHGAKVFVLPSLSEGLGRVVVEAMATGTPVIGSNVGGIPDMVESGQRGFLIPPGDEQALADRLRWVFQHPHEVQQMGACARAFAMTFFSTQAYANGYRQIFEKAQSLLSLVKRSHASSAL